jgi:hypothetical protein
MPGAGHRLLELLRSAMKGSHRPSPDNREGFSFPFRHKAGTAPAVLPVTAIQDALH